MFKQHKRQRLTHSSRELPTVIVLMYFFKKFRVGIVVGSNTSLSVRAALVARYSLVDVGSKEAKLTSYDLSLLSRCDEIYEKFTSKIVNICGGP